LPIAPSLVIRRTTETPGGSTPTLLPLNRGRGAGQLTTKMKALSARASEPGVKTVYDLIAEQPFFSGLSRARLQLLADNARQTWFESGELIFRDGDLANRFYLIVEGKVALESSGDSTHTVLLQTIGAGQLLGWSWMFSPYIWHLHARALEPTEAIFLSGTRLRDLCETDHDLGYEVFRRVAEVMMQRLHAMRRLLLEQHCPDLTVSSDWQPGQH
jgi:CRP/FNR family cyclic AMP-dependent transcriptional regulator